MIGCTNFDPLWEREGGILNPWGGEFLGISRTQKVRQSGYRPNIRNAKLDR